jgi:hypothetical protein
MKIAPAFPKNAIASPNPQKYDRIQQLERQIQIWER